MKRFLKYIKENESPLSSLLKSTEGIKAAVKSSGYDPEVTKRALDALANHHGMLRAIRLDFKKATATRDENGIMVQPLEFANPKHKEFHGNISDVLTTVTSAWNNVIDGATDAGHFDIGGPLRKHVLSGPDTAVHYVQPEEWSTQDGAGPHARGFTTTANTIPERRRNARMKELGEALEKHISLLIETAEDWTDYPEGAKEKRKLTPEEEAHYHATAQVPGGPVNVKNTNPITVGEIRELAKKLPGNHPIHDRIKKYSKFGDKVTGHEKHPELKRKIESLYDMVVDAREKHESSIRQRGIDYSMQGNPTLHLNSYTPDLDDAFRTILKEEVYCLSENVSEKELSRIMMFDRQRLQSRLFDMAKAYHAISKHLQFSSSAPNIIRGDDTQGMMKALFGSSEKTADGLRRRKDSQGRPHILSPVPTHIIRAKSEAGSIADTPISTAVPVADVEKMKERAHGHIVNLVNKISSMNPTTNHAELNDLVNNLRSDRKSFPSWTSRSALDDYVGSDSEHQGLLHGIRQKFGVVNLHNILKKPEIVDALHRAPITIQADIVSKKPKKRDLGESIVKRGDSWLVMDSKKEKVLGKHKSKKKANAQLAAIEISKMNTEAIDWKGIKTGAMQGAGLGLLTLGMIAGSGNKSPEPENIGSSFTPPKPAAVVAPTSLQGDQNPQPLVQRIETKQKEKTDDFLNKASTRIASFEGGSFSNGMSHTHKDPIHGWSMPTNAGQTKHGLTPSQNQYIKTNNLNPNDIFKQGGSMSVEHADGLRKAGIKDRIEKIKTVHPNFDSYPEEGKHVLLDLHHNIGHTGFLKFKKMHAAAKMGNWNLAADHYMDSKLPEQIGNRATANEKYLRSIK